MKKLQILLSLAAVLLISSCKKNQPTPEIPEVITKPRFLPDSTSFTVNGKHYTNELKNTSASWGYANRGTNLKFSSTDGDWSLSTGNNYWVGAADSVQYSSFSETYLEHNEGSITFSFIKNYKRENMLKEGNFYFPRTEDKFYDLGDHNYAVDFERTGRDEGVAIELSLYKAETLTSYSQLFINVKSKLTAESQSNSKFKIQKIEEVKGTDYIILEATFEANLFDKNENPVKVTDGFFRITTLKYGNRFPSLVVF